MSTSEAKEEAKADTMEKTDVEMEETAVEGGEVNTNSDTKTKEEMVESKDPTVSKEELPVESMKKENVESSDDAKLEQVESKEEATMENDKSIGEVKKETAESVEEVKKESAESVGEVKIETVESSEKVKAEDVVEANGDVKMEIAEANGDEKKEETVESKDVKVEEEMNKKAGKKRKAAAVVVATDTTKTPEVNREKRSRKSAETFQPDDFVNIDKSVHVNNGRGAHLEELKECRESIEKTPVSSDIVLTAHKLLFVTRGKPPKKDLKANILKFNGFLSAEKDADPEVQKEKDMDEESKMGQKAYKLKIPELKSLLDFFAVDRSEAKDKDGLVDALLDFLGEPSSKLLVKKGSKSKKASSTPKTQKSRKKNATEKEDEDTVVSEAGDDDADDDNSVVDQDEKEEKPEVKKKETKSPVPKKSNNNVATSKEKKSVTPSPAVALTLIHTKGKAPTDKQLRTWVSAYIICHDMGTSTIKEAMLIASKKFGVDMVALGFKSKIKQFLTDALDTE